MWSAIVTAVLTIAGIALAAGLLLNLVSRKLPADADGLIDLVVDHDLDRGRLVVAARPVDQYRLDVRQRIDAELALELREPIEVVVDIQLVLIRLHQLPERSALGLLHV